MNVQSVLCGRNKPTMKNQELLNVSVFRFNSLKTGYNLFHISNASSHYGSRLGPILMEKIIMNMQRIKMNFQIQVKMLRLK